MSAKQNFVSQNAVEIIVEAYAINAPSKQNEILYYSSTSLKNFIYYTGLQDLFSSFLEEKEIVKKRIDASITFYNGISKRALSDGQIKETLARFDLSDFPVEGLKSFYRSMFGQEPEIFASKRKADDQIGSASKRQRISSIDA